MKNILYSVCIAASAFALAACTDDVDTPKKDEAPGAVRVSFESSESLTDPNGKTIALGSAEVVYSGVVSYRPESIYWQKPLAFEMGMTDDYEQVYWQGPYIFAQDGLVSLGGYYDDGTLWDTATGVKVTDTWGGFVLSRHVNTTADKADLANQFSAWAASGANSTTTFAVAYDSNSAGEGWLAPKEYNAPQIDFSREVTPKQVSIANSAYTYPHFKGDAEDSYVVTITGWVGDIAGKSVNCVLAQGASKVSDWTKVDLSPLGSVNKLTFKVVSSDKMAPYYFCLDELYVD